MATKQTVAIVGATTHEGTIVAQRLATLSLRILLIAEDAIQLQILEENLKNFSKAAEVESLVCVKDACWEADIILLAIPGEQIAEVATKISEVATQKVVVHFSKQDSLNYSSSAALQKIGLFFPNSKIAAAFFNSSDSNQIAIAGFDHEAVNTFSNICTTAGFTISVAAQ
jgi:predicted dinucleotide-binding enzyme